MPFGNTPCGVMHSSIDIDTLKLKSVKKRKRHHMFIKVDLRNVHCVSCGNGKIANVGFARVWFSSVS